MSTLRWMFCFLILFPVISLNATAQPFDPPTVSDDDLAHCCKVLQIDDLQEQSIRSIFEEFQLQRNSLDWAHGVRSKWLRAFQPGLFEMNKNSLTTRVRIEFEVADSSWHYAARRIHSDFFERVAMKFPEHRESIARIRMDSHRRAILSEARKTNRLTSAASIDVIGRLSESGIRSTEDCDSQEWTDHIVAFDRILLDLDIASIDQRRALNSCVSELQDARQRNDIDESLIQIGRLADLEISEQSAALKLELLNQEYVNWLDQQLPPADRCRLRQLLGRDLHPLLYKDAAVSAHIERLMNAFRSRKSDTNGIRTLEGILDDLITSEKRLAKQCRDFEETSVTQRRQLRVQQLCKAFRFPHETAVITPTRSKEQIREDWLKVVSQGERVLREAEVE